MIMAKENNKTYDLVYISMFTVLIAICSWISIPAAVPFTLQTLGVFLAVGILGGKRGTIAVLVYIYWALLEFPYSQVFLVELVFLQEQQEDISLDFWHRLLLCGVWNVFLEKEK